MADSSFIRYVGDADFHDGAILSVEKRDDIARIRICGASGKVFVIDFTGVHDLIAHCPEGMILYSLSEMTCQPPLRRFIFTNWDEESESNLQIDALGFSISVKQL